MGSIALVDPNTAQDTCSEISRFELYTISKLVGATLPDKAPKKSIFFRRDPNSSSNCSGFCANGRKVNLYPEKMQRNYFKGQSQSGYFGRFRGGRQA